jgi:hypothetical protein
MRTFMPRVRWMLAAAVVCVAAACAAKAGAPAVAARTRLPGLVDALQFTAEEFDDLGARFQQPGPDTRDKFRFMVNSTRTGTAYYVSLTVKVQRYATAAEAQAAMDDLLHPKPSVVGVGYAIGRVPPASALVAGVGDACATYSAPPSAGPDSVLGAWAGVTFVRNNVFVDVLASGTFTPQMRAFPKAWDLVPLAQRMDKRIASWLPTPGKPAPTASAVPAATPTVAAKAAAVLPPLKGPPAEIALVGGKSIVPYRTVPPLPGGLAVGKCTDKEYYLVHVGSPEQGNRILWGHGAGMLTLYLADVTGDGKDELIVNNGRIVVPESLRKTMRPITVVDADGHPIEPAQMGQHTYAFSLTPPFKGLFYHNLSGTEFLLNPPKEHGVSGFSLWANLYGTGVPGFCWVSVILNESKPDPKIPWSPCSITAYTVWDEQKQHLVTVERQIPVPGYKGTFTPDLLRGLVHSTATPASPTPTPSPAPTASTGVWSKSGLIWGAPTDTTGSPTPSSP